MRVGNGAWDQRQLDVYGELLNAAARLPEVVERCPAATKTFLADLADAAAARWTEPDQGIWEVRGGAQHFLYSKLMCWVALDRAIALAGLLEANDRVERWKPIRDEIADAIITRGWSDQAQAFTQAFDSDHLDASAADDVDRRLHRSAPSSDAGHSGRHRGAPHRRAGPRLPVSGSRRPRR